MNLGVITQTNIKGQLVIPKKYREELGIDENVSLNVIKTDLGIMIYPIREVVVEGETENSYEKMFEKTLGSWTGDYWGKQEKKRKRIEIEAIRKSKQKW